MAKKIKGKIPGGCTGKGFVPGKSGNPTGTNKKKKLSDCLRELLNATEIHSYVEYTHEGKRKRKTTNIKSDNTILYDLNAILIKEGLHGNIFAIKEIFDRSEGKAPIAMTIKDNNKGMLQEFIEKMVEMSPDK